MIKAASEHQPTIDRPNPSDRTNIETDMWAGDLQFRVAPDLVKRLSQVSEWRALLHIIGEWVAICAAVWICDAYWNPLLYVVAIMWIGARQHALTILMHEATHYRVSRRKPFNDLIAELFLAWPMFVTLRAYRVSHFAHHRFINTDDDPDWIRKNNAEWKFPKSWRELSAILLKDLIGLNSHQFLAEVSDLATTDKKDKRPQRTYTIARVTYYLCVLGLLAYTHCLVEFLLYWVIPIFTWFKVIFRIRGIAEHYGIDERAYGASRTTLPSWFEALFVAPKNVNYHLEHHLYPSVPFYSLPQLHSALADFPGYNDHAHITQTYWGVLKECCAVSHAP